MKARCCRHQAPGARHRALIRIILMEPANGVRLVSNLCEIAPADVEVGMPVEVFYETFDTLDGKDLVLHQFRPAR